MMPFDIEEALTPDELEDFERLVHKFLRLAESLGRQDKVERITASLKEIREQTETVYGQAQNR